MGSASVLNETLPTAQQNSAHSRESGNPGLRSPRERSQSRDPGLWPWPPLSRGRGEESVLETVMDAFRINSLSEAAGGANFDARVCIQLPQRHDSSERSASARA